MKIKLFITLFISFLLSYSLFVIAWYLLTVPIMHMDQPATTDHTGLIWAELSFILNYVTWPVLQMFLFTFIAKMFSLRINSLGKFHTLSFICLISISYLGIFVFYLMTNQDANFNSFHDVAIIIPPSTLLFSTLMYGLLFKTDIISVET